LTSTQRAICWGQKGQWSPNVSGQIMNYDIIGDIHGHADALKALLQQMGYQDSRGAWRHPGRQAIFVGDFIDRGPKQVESVEVVRRMVDANAALAVMGNELRNAMRWCSTRDIAIGLLANVISLPMAVGRSPSNGYCPSSMTDTRRGAAPNDRLAMALTPDEYRAADLICAQIQ